MHLSNGKGRLYSGLQDRNTRIRGNMLGLSKTSIFRRVLQHEVRISQQFNKAVKVIMKQKLLEHCIIVSCIDINHASEFPPSTSPRGRKLETNKYRYIVCSGKVWLQHKASCYWTSPLINYTF